MLFRSTGVRRAAVLALFAAGCAEPPRYDGPWLYLAEERGPAATVSAAAWGEHAVVAERGRQALLLTARDGPS